MLNFEKKYRTELFNASFRMYYYDSQYALKTWKNFACFFLLIFLYLKTQWLVDVYTNFLLLNMNTLISSLTHFSYWLDYVFMQKNTLMKFEEEFSLFE